MRKPRVENLRKTVGNTHNERLHFCVCFTTNQNAENDNAPE